MCCYTCHKGVSLGIQKGDSKSNDLKIKIMEANYFIVVNESKNEVYYVTESQARAQHFTKCVYTKYDKHIVCKKVYLSESDLKEYSEVVSKKK